MAEIYQIIIGSNVETQIDNIIDYLENKVSITTAEKVHLALINAIEGLQEMPTRHGKVPFMKNKKVIFRRVKVWSYLVVFTINEEAKSVKVLDVLHEKQNPQSLLDRLSD